MKLLIYADPHICRTSSIIRGQGQRLSVRLEMLIETFNWINELAKSESCDKIICLGDLVESPHLSAEELTMLSLIDINDHEMILGNHDKYSADGFINAASLYKKAYIKPTVFYRSNEVNLVALPYGEVIDLQTFIKINELPVDNTIVFSHNDVKGIFYGNHMTNHGYEFRDILQSCRLFFNGHIHTGRELVKGRIINAGTVSGLNFNCQGAEWNPGVFIVDTKDMSYTYYENPYGFVFIQVEFNDRLKLIEYFRKLDTKTNYCIQVKVPTKLVEDAREWISKTNNILFSRVITLPEVTTDTVDNTTSFVQSSTSVYGLLHKFCEENVDRSKYDINLIQNEINLMENEG